MKVKRHHWLAQIIQGNFGLCKAPETAFSGALIRMYPAFKYGFPPEFLFSIRDGEIPSMQHDNTTMAWDNTNYN